MNQKAIDDFVAQTHEALAKIDVIKSEVSNHCQVSADKINYGHVGNLNYVNEQLDNIMNFLGLEVIE